MSQHKSQHRSQQEWLRLVQKYYNSRQSTAQFCLEHRLHPKTFDNNRRKLRHLVNLPKTTEDKPSEFIVAEKIAEPKSEVFLPRKAALPEKLRLDAGICSLHIPSSVAPAWIAELLREVAK